MMSNNSLRNIVERNEEEFLREVSRKETEYNGRALCVVDGALKVTTFENVYIRRQVHIAPSVNAMLRCLESPSEYHILSYELENTEIYYAILKNSLDRQCTCLVM